MPELSPEEIPQVAFRRRMRGYDRQQVEAFLSRVANDYAEVIVQVARADQRADEALGRQVGPLLRAAQQEAEDVRQSAEQDAARAHELLVEADQRCRRLRDFEGRLVERLRDVDRMLDALRADAVTLEELVPGADDPVIEVVESAQSG